MESESGANKVSDSGYSNSCSNSQSQRSGSSKSRKTGSNSSKSSGYCGHPSTTASSLEPVPQPISKPINEHKKKKVKSTSFIPFTLTQTSNETNCDNVAICKSTDCETTDNVEHGKVKGTSMSVSLAESDNALEVTPQSPHLITTAESAQIAADNEHSCDGEQLRTMPTGPIAPVDDISQERKSDILQNIEIGTDTVDLEQGDSTYKNIVQPENGFCCVISMYDGVVLYTIPALTTALGFPKDMWLGRSFIDFVHQKDRVTFISQITNGVAVSLIGSRGKPKDVRNSFFVNLRRYRGLKSSGYGVVEKAISYQPFHLTITFRQVNDQNTDDSHSMFLIVVAAPVYTIYKVPDETCNLSKFSTRHTATCFISHVDEAVVQYFGFFIQDMIGRSIFDFYHPGDMPMLKEIYKIVMDKCKVPGTMFKSKPYRFLVQNGEYATVETEWTSFVNPWTKKLEIVINHHRVIKGPSNPNVFDSPKENNKKKISEEILNKSKIIREEIQLLLNKLIHVESVKQQVSQRCKDLTSFMETVIMDEVTQSNLKLDLCQENNTNASVSNEFKVHLNGNTIQNKERDSVMLGEISPHREYCDSKASSETTPSYNQLNYKENIQRFFESKPMTTLSDELNAQLQSTTDTDQEGKSTSAANECRKQKCLSPIHGSGASGSGSGCNLSSESNPQMENGTNRGTNLSNDSYKAPHLTEALLSKHNADMEKIMIKRHREQRPERDNKRSHSKNLMSVVAGSANKPNQHQISGHGLKRSGSHSCEEDNHKVSKHQHQNEYKSTQVQENVNAYTPLQQCLPTTTNTTNALPININNNSYQPSFDNANLWPPFSVTVTPLHTTQPCISGSMNSHVSGYSASMVPTVCYILAPSGEYRSQPVPGQLHVPYMSNMMYPTIIGTSSLMYPPMAMIQPTTVLPHQQKSQGQQSASTGRERDPKPNNRQFTEANNNPNKELFQRPASQATSVKAEPGSVLESIASQSAANRAMSDLTLQSVCSPGPDSLMVSPQGAESIAENYMAKAEENCRILRKTNIEPNIEVDEESSYSSFYSSFLKTDTSSGSNEDDNFQEEKNKKKDKQKQNWKNNRLNPIRKPDPPWMNDVKVTPELIFRYQLAFKGIDEILTSDLNYLKETKQPDLINDQLDKLYLEMEIQGLVTKLSLEEGISSTSESSGEEESSTMYKPKKKRRSYSEEVMIYEEDAPMPPPSNPKYLQEFSKNE